MVIRSADRVNTVLFELENAFRFFMIWAWLQQVLPEMTAQTYLYEDLVLITHSFMLLGLVSVKKSFQNINRKFNLFLEHMLSFLL